MRRSSTNVKEISEKATLNANEVASVLGVSRGTLFPITCQYCRVDHVVMANEMDVAHWQNGALIEDALDYLTADERELLISGTCGACFDEKFDPEPVMEFLEGAAV